MLTLFHSPQSCSNGILYLLHEVGATFQTHIVDLRTGGQNDPAYRALNPKGKVPALGLPDGSVLTEFPAIAMWIADSFPDAGLCPATPTDRARVVSALDFIVGSAHMRGFTFVRVPQKFLDDADGQAALAAHGRAEVEKSLHILSEQMGDGDYLLGDFSAADAALFYFLSWMELTGFDLPDNLAACLTRLRARPAFAAAAPLLTR